MNTTSTPVRSQFANKKLTLGGAVRSEVLKLRTVTTNWVMVVIIAVFMIGFAALLSVAINTMAELTTKGLEGSGQAPDAEMLKAPIDMAKELGSGGMMFANMLIASLAVVFVGSEYAHRTIQPSLAAVPKRGMLYLAKAIVLAVFSFVFGTVVAAAAYFVGMLMVDDVVKDFAPFDGSIVLNWVAVGVYFMFMALMGLGFGALLRSNAGGIVVVVVLMFILQIAVQVLQSAASWVSDVLNYLPGTLGTAMIATSSLKDDAVYTQVGAGAFFALWVLGALLLGFIRIRFTDSQ